MSPEFKAKYDAALKSPHWKKLKAVVMGRCKGCCERCGVNKDAGLIVLELHHKHYQTLGMETPGDVEMLCQKCHPQADHERAEEGRERSRRALDDAQFNGFLRAKYGEGYDSPDPDLDYEQFQRWRERKDDREF